MAAYGEAVGSAGAAADADSKAMVNAFHAAALKAGDRDHGPPGPRRDFG